MNLPPPLLGSSAKDRYINALRAVIASLIPRPSRGILIQRQSSGTTYDVDPSKGSSVVGMVFRGEFNGGRQYEKSDVVKVSGGPMSGSYVAVARPPVGTVPWLGVQWVNLSKLFDQWL